MPRLFWALFLFVAAPLAAADPAWWEAAPAAPAPSFPWARMAAMAVLAAGALGWLKRRGLSRRFSDVAGESLRVLDRAALGPKAGVGLLAVGDRRIVVGYSDAGVHLVARWEDRPARAPVAPPRDLPVVLFHES